ncbi:hypothetical protein C6T61_01420 [Burkholderia multivorans]|nr:hypothetical protein C6T61_01420 [Burkholderia multivorans]
MLGVGFVIGGREEIAVRMERIDAQAAAHPASRTQPAESAARTGRDWLESRKALRGAVPRRLMHYLPPEFAREGVRLLWGH